MSTVLIAIDESGADGTTSFDDASASNHTITANGNFQWDTAQAPSGQASSGLSDGTGDFLSIASHANFGYGTGSFTIEGFWRYSANSGTQVLVDSRTGGGGGLLLYSDGSSIIVASEFGVGITATIPAAGTWRHFAVAKNSGASETKLFVDGTQVGSTYSDTNDYGASNTVRIAESKDGGASLNGWICSVRIDKGTALYTANFTPPSLPFVAGSSGTAGLTTSASTGAQTAPAVNTSVEL
jgi:hypothetical protein